MRISPNVTSGSSTEIKPLFPGRHATLLREKFKIRQGLKVDSHIFRFEKSDESPSIQNIRDTSAVLSGKIDGKPVVVIDEYFSDREASEFRDYIDKTEFPNQIISTDEGYKNGEIPCRSLNVQQHVDLMQNPLSALSKIHALLGRIGHEMGAEVSTQPLIVAPLNGNGATRALATNLVYDISTVSMNQGWHTDYDSENGTMGYRIHTKKNDYYSFRFVNGAVGQPFLITLILYVTNKNFSSDWGLGLLLKDQADNVITIPCRSMRMLLFQGDIYHTLQASSEQCPKDPAWKRLSYVVKLMIRPEDPSSSVSLKEKFIELFNEPKLIGGPTDEKFANVMNIFINHITEIYHHATETAPQLFPKQWREIKNEWVEKYHHEDFMEVLIDCISSINREFPGCPTKEGMEREIAREIDGLMNMVASMQSTNT